MLSKTCVCLITLVMLHNQGDLKGTGQRKGSTAYTCEKQFKAVACLHVIPDSIGRGLVHQTHVDNTHML